MRFILGNKLQDTKYTQLYKVEYRTSILSRIDYITHIKTRKMNLVLLTFAIALCMRLIRSQLLSFPENTVAKLGDRVAFECSTNLTIPVRWEFAAVNSSRFEYIYFNEEISSKFSTSHKINSSTTGRWILVIDSIDMSYGGSYRCSPTPTFSTEETEKSVSAQLIVIASDPVCNKNASAVSDGVVEGDCIRMWCTVNYSGNCIPVMEWTRSNGEIIDADILNTNTSTTVTSSFITQLNSSDNGVTFACKTRFKPMTTNIGTPKPSEVLATNIPTYEHLWNFHINVLYGPKNQTIVLIDKALKVGSHVWCFAESNPVPGYEWEIVGRNVSFKTGSVIEISESMVSDEEQTLRCTAVNYVTGGISSATFTFNLTGLTSTSSYDPKFNPLLIIGINIGALIFFLAIAMIICKVHQKGIRIANTPETPFQPIYAAVKKKRSGDVSNTAAIPTNHRQKQQEIPVYAEVKKNLNDKKKSEATFQISFLPEKKPKQNYVGADGTEYEEVSLLTDPNSSRAPIKQPPMFSLVETYASIDHTLTTPPPPLPPAPKRH